ncbi:MAG: PfkB domain protein [Frankiales bacterium]|nr:PfkB domain protein [Frankiales bacterium]
MREVRPGAGDVVVVGSANLDVVLQVEALPGPGTTVLASGARRGSGGKGVNQAVAAARSGASATLLAAVGHDRGGRLILDELQAAAVAVDLLRNASTSTGTAYVVVDRHGENCIVVDPGANATLVDLSAPERERLRYAAVVLCQLEVPLSTVEGALSCTKGLRVLNAAPAVGLPPDLLALVDVLVVNEHEVRQLFDGDDLAAAMTRALEAVPEIVVTLGAEGVLLARRGEPQVRVPATAARQVVDTTGAGDVFCGAYCAARARGDDRFRAVRYAVTAAALSVERPGAAASAPVRDEVLARERQEDPLCDL